MKNLTSNQTEVYEVLKKFGPLPDAALVPVAQHVMNSHQSSSGIRSRRHELVERKLIRKVDEMRMPSGRKADVWGVK